MRNLPAWIVSLIWATGCAWLLCQAATADERLKGIACRSVHLAYASSQQLTALYNEVQVEASAGGSYFMVCGWNTGYFGIQELANGKKLVLFSVWDAAKGNDPRAVEEDQRVKVLHQDPLVRVKRFGGEGTGGQCFYDFDWKVGETYRFLVTANSNGERTEYSGYFFQPSQAAWKKLVTFSTITGGQKMRGGYSFVEDFKRDRESTRHTRRALFGPAWTHDVDAGWQPITSARFTADANPVTNIDAGRVGSQFFLATGGEITNQGTPLREQIQLDASASQVPADIVTLLTNR